MATSQIGRTGGTDEADALALFSLANSGSQMRCHRVDVLFLLRSEATIFFASLSPEVVAA
jgi:hypothetical protein